MAAQGGLVTETRRSRERGSRASEEKPEHRLWQPNASRLPGSPPLLTCKEMATSVESDGGFAAALGEAFDDAVAVLSPLSGEGVEVK